MLTKLLDICAAAIHSPPSLVSSSTTIPRSNFGHGCQARPIWKSKVSSFRCRFSVFASLREISGQEVQVKSEANVTLNPIPPLKQLTSSEPAVVQKLVKAFAPATVANLGPGYDFLGCAVEGLGDFVTAEVNDSVPPGTVAISSITGDEGRLSYVPNQNCTGIAGKATLDLLGVKSVGVSLTLHKGLPLGSGLGSSAASAAAAAVAVNALFGSPLTKAQLVQAGLESEATVSGYHADNVAPSLMGGFVLIRSYDPLHLIPLAFPEDKDLFFVLVSPEFEAPTKKMRAVLPLEIAMKEHVSNCSQAAALVSAILLGDTYLLGSALSSDTIVEPKRGPLIPGLLAVKLVAVKNGAYGCTISGAGPTTVAITDNEEKGWRIGHSMVQEFLIDGKLNATAHVQKLDREGARVVELQSISHFVEDYQGMIPHKTKRGAVALERLKAFEGIPQPYNKMKQMVIVDVVKVLRLQSGHKFCLLGQLSHEVRWNHYDTIKELEEKTKLKSKVF